MMFCAGTKEVPYWYSVSFYYELYYSNILDVLLGHRPNPP